MTRCSRSHQQNVSRQDAARSRRDGAVGGAPLTSSFQFSICASYLRIVGRQSLRPSRRQYRLRHSSKQTVPLYGFFGPRFDVTRRTIRTTWPSGGAYQSADDGAPDACSASASPVRLLRHARCGLPRNSDRRDGILFNVRRGRSSQSVLSTDSRLYKFRSGRSRGQRQSPWIVRGRVNPEYRAVRPRVI
jgi:hypothetical protein